MVEYDVVVSRKVITERDTRQITISHYRCLDHLMTSDVEKKLYELDV